MKMNKNRKSVLEAIVQILSFFLVILYFMPIYMMDSYMGEMSIGFREMTFGFTVLGLTGSIGYILVLALPILIMMVMQVCSNNTTKCGGSVVFAVTDFFIISGGAKAIMDFLKDAGDVSFWLIIMYLILVIITILSIIMLFRREDKMAGDVKTVVGALSESASKVSGVFASKAAPKKNCPSCGAELEANATFCSKCGEKYVEPAAKKCHQCGEALQENDTFCSKCGSKYEAPAENICPQCGAKNDKDAAFCEKCGTKLG